MELSLFDLCRKRNLNLRMLIFLFAITLFYAVICTPVSLLVSSDILLSETVLPLLIDVLMLLCNYLFYWVSFAIVLYAIGRFEVGNCISLFGIYVGAVFFRYLANITAGFLVIGFPTWEDFLSDHLLYLLIDIGMDLILMAVMVLIVSLTFKKASANSSPLAGLPIDRLFDLKNPIQLAAFWSAVIPAAVQLISRVFYDAFYYGAPTSLIDLLWMVIYYVSDFANVVIGYLVIVLILNRIFMKEEKARIDYDSATLI